jgi:hypothetical protein
LRQPQRKVKYQLGIAYLLRQEQQLD